MDHMSIGMCSTVRLADIVNWIFYVYIITTFNELIQISQLNWVSSWFWIETYSFLLFCICSTVSFIQCVGVDKQTKACSF